MVGEDIKEPEGGDLVNELGKKDAPADWSEEKTRNETDIIRTRIKKTIEQDLQDNPYAQKIFSELLEEAIKEAEAQFEHPYKQYALFKDLEEQVEKKLCRIYRNHWLSIHSTHRISKPRSARNCCQPYSN